VTRAPRRPRVLDAPVERIVVLRALMLGDMLCAVPALRALRAGFPRASTTLVGLPWARALVGRLDCLDDFVELPGWPGLAELPYDATLVPDFLAQVQARHYDLAVQLHGAGRITNPLVACFGARHTAGFFDAHAWRPEADAQCWVPWPEHGQEIERLLTLTDRLGLPRQGTHLEFPVTQADRDALRAVFPDADRRPYVVVHAGAQLPSRRWPVQRFAEVADRLAEQGFTVVLTGGAPEAGLVNTLAAAMRHEPVNLVGRTTLWTLGALVEGAERVVCNDTGVSHVAAALKRPSVVVSCGSDTARWAPLDRELHRVLAHDVACRPCLHAVCPLDHACATAIEVPEVMRWLPAQPARSDVVA
jgi:ADP-heptose:LPS heptosyltransferase